MSHPHGAQYEDMARQDSYDPRNAKYIIPVSEDEMTHKSTELLDKQIAQLEDLLESRQAEANLETYQHYERVIADMRYEACQRMGNSRSTHLRTRSDPAKQLDVAANDGPQSFTHARIRSAPALAFECDTVLLDDSSPQANRVHGSRLVQSPGKQLVAGNSTYTTFLGPSVEPPVSPLPKQLAPHSWHPYKGAHCAVPQGAQESTPTALRLLIPSPGISPQIAEVSTMLDTYVYV